MSINDESKMSINDESKERERLLQSYWNLVSNVDSRGIFFRLRRDYRELQRAYERYIRVPNEAYAGAPYDRGYLCVANRAFSKKLSEFEELIGGEDE